MLRRPPIALRSAALRPEPAAAAAALLLVPAFLATPPAAAPLRAQERAPEVEYLNAGTVLPSGLPFSEAVRLDGTLFLSGMVGVVPGTDTLVAGGIAPETRQTMENIEAVLRAHGSSLDRVVKCTVFLADIGEWDAFNQVYTTFFSPPYPARSALGADGLALDARVEVECMAAVGPGPEGGASDTGGGGGVR